MIFKQKQGKTAQNIKSTLKVNMYKTLIIRYLRG